MVLSCPPTCASASTRERASKWSGRSSITTAADAVDGLPRFWGGVVGVFGHELVRTIEKLPVPAHHGADRLPVFELLVTDTMVIFDNLSQRVKVVSSASPGDDGGDAAAREAAAARIARVMAAVRRAGPGLRPFSVDESVEVQARLAPEARESSYPALVNAAKEYVKAGDVFPAGVVPAL